MTKFTATFSNGQTITRNSDHAYAFAWAVVRIADGVVEATGFSADRANAAKSAQSKMWVGVSDRDAKNPALRRYWAKMAKDEGLASVDAWIAVRRAEAAEHNAARRIEVVAL